MTQIFIIGSSSVYGVGAEFAGWADLVKQKLHQKMYGVGGVGEKYEVFNFGFSGATIDFFKETFPSLLEKYSRGGKIITIFSPGGNNAKAKNSPTNYVSTLEEFGTEIADFLNLLSKLSDKVIVVGGGSYDESKVFPKISPFDGSKSYFSNERKKKFQARAKEIAQSMNLEFVDLEVATETWIKKYLYKDGLHPNQAGYNLIADKVWQKLENLL